MSHIRNQRSILKHRLVLTVVLAGLLAWAALLPERAGLAMAQTAGPSWTYTGSLNAARGEHTATLLPSGKVLVAGGASTGNRVTNSAELYDLATGTWSFTGSLNIGRQGHTATLLQSGKVLVAGGCAGICGIDVAVDRAELYDPATGIWTLTGKLHMARFEHTATLLQSGKVLVIGGWIGEFNVHVDAELYDPVTGTWSITESPIFGSGFGTGYTATLLQNGKVLVAGGKIEDDPPIHFYPLADAQLYDPTTGTWSATGSLHTARYFHTATLLPNGQVLVAGGETNCSFLACDYSTDTAELYDPATGRWSHTGNLSHRAYHTATLLPNGQVLVAGGVSVGFTNISSAEIYDPVAGGWAGTASLNTPRSSQTATLLSSGKVLLVGGDALGQSAELYDSGVVFNPNRIDDSEFFVRQHYLDFLNREPDRFGLAFWTNEINICGGDARCVEAKRINVSAAYFLSIEFQNTGYFVYRIYKASYGNLPGAPVPVTLNEFLPDTQKIAQGVIVNQSGWEQALEHNKQAFTSEFAQRAHFASAYPNAMTPAAFVDTLFANAGVTPADAERAAAINEFGSAATISDTSAQARALRRVAENSTLAEQEFNRAFVLMQYFGYLRRNPNDAPDSNFDSYNFWLNKLNQFDGNFVNAEMVKAFIQSIEYRNRFAPK